MNDSIPGRPAQRAPIILVEDDPGIGTSLLRTLLGQGLDAEWASTGEAARAMVTVDTPLVVMDLGLPDVDGLDLCRELRARNPGLQVLMLTARGEEADVVLGLDAGAEDYLVKPFRLAELLARIRARLRRMEAPGQRRTCGVVSADASTREVATDGTPVDLRPKEFDLLWMLLDNQHRVVPRHELIEEVWDTNWYGPTKTLDIHIHALRQKLDLADRRSCIQTVRGVGYRMIG